MKIKGSLVATKPQVSLQKNYKLVKELQKTPLFHKMLLNVYCNKNITGLFLVAKGRNFASLLEV